MNKTIDYTKRGLFMNAVLVFYKTLMLRAKGSIPKNVRVWTCFSVDSGHYFATSDIINTKDLEEFEIKEKQPKTESIPEKSRIAIQNYLEKPISKKWWSNIQESKKLTKPQKEV